MSSIIKNPYVIGIALLVLVVILFAGKGSTASGAIDGTTAADMVQSSISGAVASTQAIQMADVGRAQVSAKIIETNARFRLGYAQTATNYLTAQSIVNLENNKVRAGIQGAQIAARAAERSDEMLYAYRLAAQKEQDTTYIAVNSDNNATRRALAPFAVQASVAQAQNALAIAQLQNATVSRYNDQRALLGGLNLLGNEHVAGGIGGLINSVTSLFGGGSGGGGADDGGGLDFGDVASTAAAAFAFL